MLSTTSTTSYTGASVGQIGSGPEKRGGFNRSKQHLAQSLIEESVQVGPASKSLLNEPIQWVVASTA